MENVTLRLAGILGKRAFWVCGLVTMLIVTLLATVNLSSRHALKLYIEDQINRLPWDVAIYQISEFPTAPEVAKGLRATEGIEKAEHVSFLRSMIPPAITPEVDGKPMRTSWLSVLSASDVHLLPPEIRPTGDRGVIMALTGPKHLIGDAFLALQGTKELRLGVKQEGTKAFQIFSSPIERVVRIEIPELNRWLMDRVGSISFVPEVGVILVMAGGDRLVATFDRVSRGMPPNETDSTDMSVQASQYFPEVVHLARVDRKALVSTWDVEGSLGRLEALTSRIEELVKKVSEATYVDNGLALLLKRVEDIARIIGLISILISLPLLWIAWVLMANLSGLLMLNERRKLGLMRLRGVPGRMIGRGLLLSIGTGCLLGGLVGLMLGTFVPLYLYEGGFLPWGTLLKVQQPLFLILFLVVGLVLVLLVSRRLIRYATTISPLEAARRVSTSELSQMEVRFGVFQLLSLLLGSYKLMSWVFNFSLGAMTANAFLVLVDRAFDFVGLPLFLYGLVMLLASRHRWMQMLLKAFSQLLGGALGNLFLKHLASKSYRIASFLLIVALMAAVSLYPTVMSGSFWEKGFRGTRVQMGTEVHVAIKPSDFISVDKLKGDGASQVAAVKAALSPSLEKLRGLRGVASVHYIMEALLPRFFVPGYGLKGVPLYLVADQKEYLKTVYWEEELGEESPFSRLVAGIGGGGIGVSPAIASFWNLSKGTKVLLGPGKDGEPVFAKTAGTLRFLPGASSRSVNDRESYVSARMDYLNYLFSNNAFLAIDADNPALGNLEILMPQISLKVKLKPGLSESEAETLMGQIKGALPSPPLDIKELSREAKKVGSDMFIFLAMENMRIYLIGGLLLAVIAILATALVNYLEDRRTLALLRVRGASPSHIFKLLCSSLLPPTIVGVLLGMAVALFGGYGMTNLIWGLRKLLTLIVYLPTHLVITTDTVWVGILLFGLLSSVILVFSLWAFRQTARESLKEE